MSNPLETGAGGSPTRRSSRLQAGSSSAESAGVTRRRFLPSLTVPAMAPAILKGATGTKEKPNILFVLSDDHSVPYLGAYGASYMNTPNLDAFAQQSVRFNKMFTTAPQCVPSRTGIMTGRSPVSADMGRFGLPLPPTVTTLPEELRKSGYHTGVCGRYFHLDGVINPNGITQEIYTKYKMRTWDKRVDFKDVSPQTQTAEKLQAFLNEVPKGKPWFFWINYSDPHHPWDRDAGKVNPNQIQLPPHLPDLPGVRDDLARYCGEVERADGFFRDDLAVLKKNGLTENTLVVFMGDNGMAFPHGKGSLYDPGANVPFLVHWPGVTKPAVVDSLISGEDLAPTMIEAGGGTVPKEMTGRSFLGLLNGTGYEKREYVFCARIHHGNGSFKETTKADEFDLSRSVRSERYKLIYNCTPHMEYQPVDSTRDPGWQQILAAHREGKLSPEHEKTYFGKRPVMELYDLQSDPGELHNIYDREDLAGVQKQLLYALQEKMISDRDYLPSPLGDALPKAPAPPVPQ